MNFKEIKEKLKAVPSYSKKGAAFLSRLWDCTEEDIVMARKEIRDENNDYNPHTDISKEEAENTPYIKDRSKKEDTETITLVSNKPLSPSEIDELAQVDNITSRVSSYWLKSSTKYTYTYAIQIKNTINRFYSIEEIGRRLHSIIPKIEPKHIKKSSNSEELGLLCISDIHAGAQNSELNIHGITYSEKDLDRRLQKIIENLLESGKQYNILYIANLGDSVDGWDGFTSRKSHPLGSNSNKDQFDIYFRCMVKFYGMLFESGIANYFIVRNILDSNHDGVDFAYICNKTVEYYLSSKYPEVAFEQQEKFIDLVDLGSFGIAFAHGKDAKIMKYPMKRTLDDRLDLWANQYFSLNTKNPFKILLKGDLHVFGVEVGKFGTYVNCPSLYGTSDYISLNYGVTRPGALIINIPNVNKEEVYYKPIWLD